MKRLPNGSYVRDDDPGEPSTGNPRLSVTDEEAMFLALLVKDKRVLEIGTGLGVSTSALASTAVEVVTVDIDPWVHETIWPKLPSHVFTSASPFGWGRFDAVFIDGDHTTEQVCQDVAIARDVCDGLIIMHDVAYLNVARGLDDQPWYFVPTTHGIGLSLCAIGDD